MPEKKLTLKSAGIKYKLKIGVYLISILPFLITIYIFATYIFSRGVFTALHVASLIIIGIIISYAGFLILNGVFVRIAILNMKAKLIVSGDLSLVIEENENDELGDLVRIINQLAGLLREDKNELKKYGEQNVAIRIKMNKYVQSLTCLLEISSLILKSEKLEKVFVAAVEKCRWLTDQEVSFLLCKEEARESFSAKFADGTNCHHLLDVKLSPQDEILKVIQTSLKPLVIDQKNRPTSVLAAQAFEKFGVKNLALLPVCLQGKIAVILAVGSNKEGFTFHDTDIEVLDIIIARQLAIAIENDLLLHKLEKLEIKDGITGLYNEMFIRKLLQEEIRRAIAFQRPCGFILINIDNFLRFNNNFGSSESEAALKKIASLIRSSISEIDRLGKFGDDEFAVILPEMNKRKVQDVAEEIRKKIEFSFSEVSDESKRITVSGGVSENPLDGITAEELVFKARQSLNLAKAQGKNRIFG